MKIKKGIYKLSGNEITIDMVAGQIVVSIAGQTGAAATFDPSAVRANSESLFFEAMELAVAIFGAREGKPNQPNCSQAQVSQIASEINRFAFANGTGQSPA